MKVYPKFSQIKVYINYNFDELCEKNSNSNWLNKKKTTFNLSSSHTECTYKVASSQSQSIVK